jgi:hypothetical protein
VQIETLYNCLPGSTLHWSAPKLLLVNRRLTSQSWGVAQMSLGTPSTPLAKLNVLTTRLRHTGPVLVDPDVDGNDLTFGSAQVLVFLCPYYVGTK